MADYYPLLAKAIAGLPGSTAAAREAVYERARKALFGQLRTLDPPVPEDVIEREAQSLERAVAQLETEIVARSGPEGGAPFSDPDLAGFRPPASPASERSAPPPPRSGLAGPDRGLIPPVRPARPAPPLKIRRDQAGRSNESLGLNGPAASTASPESSWLSKSAPAGPKSFAARDEPQGHAVSMGPPGRGLDPGIADETSLENGYFEATPYEPFAAEGQGEIPEGYEPAQRTWGEDQRPYAPRPAGDGAGAKRFGIVFAIVALVVALVAIAAYRLRDRPEDLVRLAAPAPAVQGEAGAKGKIIDRIEAGGSAGASSSSAESGEAAKNGSVSPAPVVPVAHRAALLVEAPDEPSKVKTIVGTVVWRVENVSNGPDEPLSMAVRAEVEIPEAKLQAEMILQKNFDSTLPASHTIKVRLLVPPDSPLANLKQVNVLMRSEEIPAGEALKGITVPVTDNSFLIGLSRGADEAANLDLLRSREWFDIAMVLANGHIAKLTFEKGPSGRGALDDAIASWQAQQ